MSSRRSYPRPRGPTPADAFPKWHVRQGIPRPLLDPPHGAAPVDRLPSSHGVPFAANYLRTTHVFPAAWPRTHPEVPEPRFATGGQAVGKRKPWQDAADEILKNRMDYEMGRKEAEPGSERALWCAVNRYVRQEQKSATQGPPGLSA
jgi:hypothetical protein